MANTRYRRGGAYAADMAVYARAMAADNSAQLSRVKRNPVSYTHLTLPTT